MQTDALCSRSIADPHAVSNIRADAFPSSGAPARGPMRHASTTPLRSVRCDATAVSLDARGIYMEYTNNDGDSVSILMESLRYQNVSASFEGTGENGNPVARAIRDEIISLEQAVMKEFVESLGIEWKEDEKVEKAADAGIEGLPEYWNAENTSQRIVDFALSFYGLYEGSGEEFYAAITDAVDLGFSKARDLLGSLPDEVGNLVDETYERTMEKLREWATAGGMTVEASGTAA